METVIVLGLMSKPMKGTTGPYICFFSSCSRLSSSHSSRSLVLVSGEVMSILRVVFDVLQEGE